MKNFSDKEINIILETLAYWVNNWRVRPFRMYQIGAKKDEVSTLIRKIQSTFRGEEER